jgi:transcriptional regulator with PAS, ATPase and Fis domain
MILKALKKHKNLENAAKALGVTSKSLYNYRINLGLHSVKYNKKEKI